MSTSSYNIFTVPWVEDILREWHSFCLKETEVCRTLNDGILSVLCRLEMGIKASFFFGC